MEWIYLAQDRDHWYAVLNMLMKLLVSKGGEFFNLLIDCQFPCLILRVREFEVLSIVGKLF